MSLFHKLLFILPFGMLASCTSLPNKNKGKSSSKIKTVKVDHKRETSSKTTSQTQKKFTEKEILDRLEGSYIFTDNSSASFLKLNFVVKNNQLNYRLKTNTRNSAGLAKLSIDENGQIFIIFPKEFDGYEGDLTSEDRTRYKSEKPQEISMLFDPEFYTIDFQNYGNAMNSYTIFDELGNEKFIQAYKKLTSEFELIFELDKVDEAARCSFSFLVWDEMKFKNVYYTENHNKIKISGILQHTSRPIETLFPILWIQKKIKGEESILGAKIFMFNLKHQTIRKFNLDSRNFAQLKIQL